MKPTTQSTPLAQRTAIVTGGSEGIGRAIAEVLAGAGVSVALTSRDRGKAGAVATEVADGRPGRVLGLACDVRDASSCEALVRGAVDAFGALDTLVNNAGVGIVKPIQDLSAEDWRAQVETNLHGVFYCVKAALPHLRALASGDAWIINVGSLAGRNSFGGGTGYNASKFGLVGMTEAMMIDLRYEGIRTSIIMPGSVDTRFRDGEVGRDWGPAPRRRRPSGAAPAHVSHRRAGEPGGDASDAAAAEVVPGRRHRWQRGAAAARGCRASWRDSAAEPPRW